MQRLQQMILASWIGWSLVGVLSYGQAPPGQTVRVTAVNSQYRSITSNYTGTLATGQDASILLAGIDFNNTGGPLLFNHPGGIASDGTRLLLADRNNNRVLIWNSLPTGNTAPNLVLGQANFITNNPGTGRAQMNWPVSVKTDGRRVIVADAYNDRLLIWNTFPTQNGQAADLVIKLNDLRWPWGLWTDGTRLVATGTGSQRTLIWNQFPTRDNQPQSLTLQARGQMGTPRTVTSNGQNLIVGDHNSRAAVAPSSGPGNFVWKTFPTTEDQAPDFFISDHLSANAAWLQGDFTRDGKLVMLGRSLYVWNQLMTDANDTPDVTVSDFQFDGGDGSDAIVVNGKVFISLYNGNKILVYNAPPTSATQPPDYAIGSPNVTTNTLATNFMLNNPFPATDGKSLWASSDFERRLYVWKALPDQSGAAPDFVYDLPEGPWDNEVWGNRLALPWAGPGRGIFASLEVDDEVLVAFEHGDINRPYIIGALWNGKDQPPSAAVKDGRKLALIQTAAGQTLALDDGANQITISTGNQTITLDRQGKKLSITAGAAKLALDTSSGAVSLETSSTITLKAAGGSLEIGASGIELKSSGTLKVDASAMLDLTSSAIVNVRGSLVKINS